MGFIHLHTHTEYSLLDGANKVKNYVAKVKESGQTAAAITDHGNMFGAISFYQECQKQGIKPIIGCEVYVAPGSMEEKKEINGTKYYHLVLLAENMTGYNNLMKLVTMSYDKGFYYKPRVDKAVLKQYHEGIIASSACLAGEVARAALESHDKARAVIKEYEDIFGHGNFYLEVQNHLDGSREQMTVNAIVMQLGKEFDIPVIATNDCHYTNAKDAEAHEVLLCMQTQSKLSDPDHMVYAGGQYYVKTEEEMRELFPNNPEVIDNTVKLADRCNVSLEFGNYHIPKFDVPEGYSSTKDFLKSLTEKGFEEKFKNNPEYDKNALDKIWNDTLSELQTIEKMGFVEYILIVWDYINWSRTHDCWIGPGRGSAAGSKVCYCIGITNIDPVKYGLLFERFLNPERVSMPKN